MRRRINIHFAITSLVAILFTVFFSTLVYYDMYQTEIIQSLKTYTNVLKNSGVIENEQIDNSVVVVEHLRMTLINRDGTIAYETNANIGSMDNHGQRPEVQEAFDDGEGEAVRRSETLDKNTFYYAVRLSNGQVLRVAKEAGSILSFLISILPYVLFILVAVFALCVTLANFLTKSIIRPIEELAQNMDDTPQEVVYREMQPFVDTIQQQHQDIIKSSQIRQDFTASVSHELKTPLTSISGYAYGIETGMASPEDAKRFAGGIDKISQRLLTLINDIIRLSELDSAERIISMEFLNLYELAEHCVEMLQFSARKHEVSLELKGSSCQVRANREMMTELLYNLTSNAIRYNVPGGTVTIEVKREGEYGILSVSDTGIGIPAEDQERVFERFYRVDKSRSKSTGGTGLGLAIVKHIVAKHEAKIELKSEVGKGTCITVRLAR